MEPMYGLCGPHLTGWPDTTEAHGIRCPRCQASIDATEEDTYCGRYVIVAVVESMPAS